MLDRATGVTVVPPRPSAAGYIYYLREGEAIFTRDFNKCVSPPLSCDSAMTITPPDAAPAAMAGVGWCIAGRA